MGTIEMGNTDQQTKRLKTMYSQQTKVLHLGECFIYDAGQFVGSQGTVWDEKGEEREIRTRRHRIKA